jgi:hypothetical protein
MYKSSGYDVMVVDSSTMSLSERKHASCYGKLEISKSPHTVFVKDVQNCSNRQCLLRRSREPLSLSINAPGCCTSHAACMVQV